MPAARADLENAIAFLAQRSTSGAERVLLTHAVRAAESLETLSERGRIVPELSVPGLREIIVGRFRLVYEVLPERVEIVGFIHGARDFRAWCARQGDKHERARPPWRPSPLRNAELA